MTFEREDFDAAQKAKRDPKEQERQNLAMIRQAGVAAEMLTGNPDWDKFLTYLQPALEANTAQRDAFMRDLANPLLVNVDEVSKRRIAVIRLNERIEVLQWVIALPAHLIRLGGQAAEQLKSIAAEEVQ